MKQVSANDNDAVLSGEPHEAWLIILDELSARSGLDIDPKQDAGQSLAGATQIDFRTMLLDFASELTVSVADAEPRFRAA